MKISYVLRGARLGFFLLPFQKYILEYIAFDSQASILGSMTPLYTTDYLGTLCCTYVLRDIILSPTSDLWPVPDADGMLVTGSGRFTAPILICSTPPFASFHYWF